MAKKHKKPFKKYAAGYRNAAPRPPRGAKPDGETPLARLAYTAGGAAGTALAGAFLTHEGWAPKTMAIALGAVGAGLAWKGDDAGVRSVGAGMMAAAGSQLALEVIQDRDSKANPPHPPTPQTAKKPSNMDGLPPAALQGALERAQARLALAAQTGG